MVNSRHNMKKSLIIYSSKTLFTLKKNIHKTLISPEPFERHACVAFFKTCNKCTHFENRKKDCIFFLLQSMITQFI